MVDLLLLTSFDQLILIMKILFAFVTKGGHEEVNYTEPSNSVGVSVR